MKAPSFIRNSLIMAKNSYNYRFENYREISHINLGSFKKFSKNNFTKQSSQVIILKLVLSSYSIVSRFNHVIFVIKKCVIQTHIFVLKKSIKIDHVS